jgi:Asp-tRNA(Asn)/Glu-tRNA(Gln) amidotransferase A subunit family amidase
MGVKLIPVEIPDFPFAAIVPVLEAEGAAAFDDLTRSGRDKLLTGQLPFDWPNQFRIARFYSAVDYIQAMRARTLAIAEMAKLFAQVDVIVTPSQGNQLQATNLTGHPAVIVPNGIRGNGAPKSESEEDGALTNAGGPGTPVSMTFLGGLYSDARRLPKRIRMRRASTSNIRSWTELCRTMCWLTRMGWRRITARGGAW